MHTAEVFKARHLYARRTFYDDLVENYSEEQLRTPIQPALNTLIWLLWHVARVEDAGITRFVTKDLLYIVKDENEEK